MARGRCSEAWDHTATLWAAQINGNPFRKGRPVRADQLHPYGRGRHSGQPMLRMKISNPAIKQMFKSVVGGKKG